MGGSCLGCLDRRRIHFELSRLRSQDSGSELTITNQHHKRCSCTIIQDTVNSEIPGVNRHTDISRDDSSEIRHVEKDFADIK